MSFSSVITRYRADVLPLGLNRSQFNCNVFVPSFCPSILLSTDLYFEWVSAKWPWIINDYKFSLFTPPFFLILLLLGWFLFYCNPSCTPHESGKKKTSFEKSKWIKYYRSELKAVCWSNLLGKKGACATDYILSFTPGGCTLKGSESVCTFLIYCHWFTFI